jgi:hypothetical protein
MKVLSKEHKLSNLNTWRDVEQYFVEHTWAEVDLNNRKILL